MFCILQEGFVDKTVCIIIDKLRYNCAQCYQPVTVVKISHFLYSLEWWGNNSRFFSVFERQQIICWLLVFFFCRKVNKSYRGKTSPTVVCCRSVLSFVADLPAPLLHTVKTFPHCLLSTSGSLFLTRTVTVLFSLVVQWLDLTEYFSLIENCDIESEALYDWSDLLLLQ